MCRDGFTCWSICLLLPLNLDWHIPYALPFLYQVRTVSLRSSTVRYFMASSAFKNGVFFPQGQQHGLSLALALHVFSLVLLLVSAAALPAPIRPSVCAGRPTRHSSRFLNDHSFGSFSGPVSLHCCVSSDQGKKKGSQLAVHTKKYNRRCGCV